MALSLVIAAAACFCFDGPSILAIMFLLLSMMAA
jgi:hypothetical protein